MGLTLLENVKRPPTNFSPLYFASTGIYISSSSIDQITPCCLSPPWCVYLPLVPCRRLSPILTGSARKNLVPNQRQSFCFAGTCESGMICSVQMPWLLDALEHGWNGKHLRQLGESTTC
ncbi:unnamed protein product [Ectocarpus sp. 13 AM-2016]